MKIQQCLIEIHARGLNDYKIAEQVGAPQASIHRLRTGKHKSCNYERGLKIVDLYKKICGSSESQETDTQTI